MVAITSRKSILSRRNGEATISDRVFRCICGAEFCYLCGAKWKTCGCDGLADEEFDERENQEMFDLAVRHIVHIHDYGLTEWDDGSITLI